MEITKKVIEETAAELIGEEGSRPVQDEEGFGVTEGIKALRDLLLQRKDEVARDF